MQKSILYSIILFLLGCANNSNHWEQFAGVGLPDKNEHYKDIRFTDDSTGYLGGSRDYTIDGITEQITVLYKTTDCGKHWKQIPINVKNIVSNIFAFKDTVVLVVQDIRADTNYIFRSSNNGLTWDKLLTYNKANFIRCSFFKDPQDGHLEIENRDNGKQYLLDYHRNKWDTLNTISKNYYNPKMSNDYVFSLIPSQSQSANSKGVLITSINDKKTLEILFDKPYYIGGAVTDNKNYWLTCNDGTNNKIFRINDGKLQIIKLGNFSKYRLSEIFAYNNKIVIFAHLKEDVSALGVTYHCLVTEDNGKKWQIEDFTGSITKPSYMYKDHFLITAGAPPGVLHIRK
jgi:hypothetical protein